MYKSLKLLKLITVKSKIKNSNNRQVPTVFTKEITLIFLGDLADSHELIPWLCCKCQQEHWKKTGLNLSMCSVAQFLKSSGKKIKD